MTNSEQMEALIKVRNILKDVDCVDGGCKDCDLWIDGGCSYLTIKYHIVKKMKE